MTEQKFEVEEEGVKFEVSYSFSYDGTPYWSASYKNVLTGAVDKVSSSTVKEKKPALYSKIVATILPLKDAYTKAQELAKAREKAEQVRKALAFAANVQGLVPSGYTVKDGGTNYCYVEKGTERASIKYLERESYKPWVYCISYKDVRCGTLAKALEKATEHIEAEIARNAAATSEERRQIEIAKSISTPEVTFERRTEYHSSRRGGYSSVVIGAVLKCVELRYNEGSGSYPSYFKIVGVDAKFATLEKAMAVVKAIDENKVI